MSCDICNDTGTDYLGRPCRIHGNEMPPSDSYLEMSYSEDEPNPLTIEGAGPCTFVVDGRRAHGTVVVRSKVEDPHHEPPAFELYFIPDPT